MTWQLSKRLVYIPELRDFCVSAMWLDVGAPVVGHWGADRTNFAAQDWSGLLAQDMRGMSLKALYSK